MQPEQLGAQYTEDCENNCGLHKGSSCTFTHPAGLTSGHHTSGLHHHPGPQAGGEHQLHHLKSSAEDVFPEAAKEMLHASNNNGSALCYLYLVHPSILY